MNPVGDDIKSTASSLRMFKVVSLHTLFVFSVHVFVKITHVVGLASQMFAPAMLRGSSLTGRKVFEGTSWKHSCGLQSREGTSGNMKQKVCIHGWAFTSQFIPELSGNVMFHINFAGAYLHSRSPPWMYNIWCVAQLSEQQGWNKTWISYNAACRWNYICDAVLSRPPSHGHISGILPTNGWLPKPASCAEVSLFSMRCLFVYCCGAFKGSTIISSSTARLGVCGSGRSNISPMCFSQGVGS